MRKVSRRHYKYTKRTINKQLVMLISVICLCICTYIVRQFDDEQITGSNNSTYTKNDSVHSDNENTSTYEYVNNNIPYFTEENYTTDAFEYYSELDSLGRCGVAFANICKELMPTQERGTIGNVKPSGWHTIKYDFINGKYLYNRCHLIAFMLAGENANNKNLITGTRSMNVKGMLPFEDMVHDYVEDTDNHVLYRVTPDFEDDNLLASGVQMEAWSVEDSGEGICYNVYVYNVESGVEINYFTGDSR